VQNFGGQTGLTGFRFSEHTEILVSPDFSAAPRCTRFSQ